MVEYFPIKWVFSNMAPSPNRQLGPKLFSSKVEGKETMWKNQAARHRGKFTKKLSSPLVTNFLFSWKKFPYHYWTRIQFWNDGFLEQPIFVNPAHFMGLANNYAKTFRVFWQKWDNNFLNEKKGTELKWSN